MRKASDFHSVGSRNVRHFENTSMLFIQDCHAKLFPRITFAKSALAKRDNHGRKISVNGPVSGRRKEKKNSGILQNK